MHHCQTKKIWPLIAVPNVTAHPSTASVPITVLLYNGPLLSGFNVPNKGLTASGDACAASHGSRSLDRRTVTPTRWQLATVANCVAATTRWTSVQHSAHATYSRTQYHATNLQSAVYFLRYR